MPVQYGANFTSDTNRKPSPTIWGDCPLQAIRNGTTNGVIFDDDFTDYNLPATQTTEVTQGRYKAFCSTAGQFITDGMPHATNGVAIAPGGFISVLCDTDNDSCAIGTTACPFSLLTTLSGKLWFEGRIATTSILTNMGQLFFGLAENQCGTAFSATLPLGNADVQSTNIAMIGFNRLEDGLGVLNTSYSDVGATAWTDILASASTALAANTWIKLGMKFDFSQTTRFGTFYVNGVDTGTYVSKATVLALTSMDVVGLGPCLAFFADSGGTACYNYLDWWRVVETF